MHIALIKDTFTMKPGKLFQPTVPTVFKSADVTKACSTLNGQAAILALLQKMCNRVLETHNMPVEDTLPGASVTLTYWSQYFTILTRLLMDAAFELDKQAATKAAGAEKDDLMVWAQRAKQLLLDVSNLASIMFRLQGTEAPQVEIQRALAQNPGHAGGQDGGSVDEERSGVAHVRLRHRVTQLPLGATEGPYPSIRLQAERVGQYDAHGIGQGGHQDVKAPDRLRHGQRQ